MGFGDYLASWQLAPEENEKLRGQVSPAAYLVNISVRIGSIVMQVIFSTLPWFRRSRP
jgi:hypothetical protein